MAADPDGDGLTLAILRMPNWATFDSATGRLAGTLNESDLGSYSNIVISVSDGRSSVALPTFDIVVNQVGEGAATLSWTRPTQNGDGSALIDLAGYRIDYGRSARKLNRTFALDIPDGPTR